MNSYYYIRTCTCKLYPQNCKSRSSHECVCGHAYRYEVVCKSTVHQCSCRVSVSKCKSKEEHVCSCTTGIVKECRSTSIHNCVCRFTIYDAFRYNDKTKCRANPTDHKKICICNYSIAAIHVCESTEHHCQCENTTRFCRFHASYEIFTLLWEDTTSYFNWIPEEVLLVINDLYLHSVSRRMK